MKRNLSFIEEKKIQKKEEKVFTFQIYQENPQMETW